MLMKSYIMKNNLLMKVLTKEFISARIKQNKRLSYFIEDPVFKTSEAYVLYIRDNEDVHSPFWLYRHNGTEWVSK